jgi:peptide/nickel transport system permease protein
MTVAATQSSAAMSGPVGKPRSYVASVVANTLTQWGARIGMAWIVTMGVLAVFAPLLASSHPILIKQDGAWSSPMIRHLTSVDVILLVATFAGAALWWCKFISGRTRFWLWVALVVIVAGVGYKFIVPPKAVVFSQYREAQAAGEIELAIHTIIPYSPLDRLRDSKDDMRYQPPSREHWMGTTINGEDLASRMIHAARIALTIGFIATGVALIIGVIIGGIMGYFSGIVDLIGMRLVEIFAAIPTIFLLIAIVAFYERNLYLIMFVIGLTGWVGYANFIRAEFLRLRQQDFVVAARACGLPLWSILFRHMLPNGIAPVLVSASFGVASAIMSESVLSFLGLGLVEEPSWGQMLSQALQGGSFYWWVAVYPGGAIFLTVFAYVLFGEAVRDAIDPHLQKAAQL